MPCKLCQECALFANKSSLRGVGKAQNSPHIFLKILWAIFVLSMTVLLSIGVILLVWEYLEFQATIQTHKKANDPTPFPSITICSHRPFSEKAYKLWSQNLVKSPRQFSADLRKVMKHSLMEQDIATAQTLFFNDKMSSYFQNIAPEDADKISHVAEHVLVYCILKYGNTTSVGHIDDCEVDIHKFTHPNFINCYTVTPKKEVTTSLTTAAFVVAMGRGEPDYNGTEQGFVQSMLDQSHGARITLHAGATMPQIDKEGFNVAPNAFSEVKYVVKKQERVNRPTNKCLSNVTSGMLKIVDAGTRSFNYSAEACISQKTGEKILNKCNCVSAFHLRTMMPKEPNITYCHTVHLENPDVLINNIKCLRMLDEEEVRNELMEAECLEPCHEMLFDTTVSTSRWLPTVWQMHWSKTISDAWRVFNNKSGEVTSAQHLQATRNVDLFVNSTNLQNLTSFGYYGDSGSMHFSSGDFLFVSVVRSSYTSLMYVEKLKITSSVLLSRFGGLGSLTLGLTCSFVVELIEFFFLCTVEKRKRKKEERRRKRQCTDPENTTLNNNANGEL